MALNLYKRPNGYINSSSSSTGTYTNASSIITNNSHGLSTGSIIYISNNQAIGFWWVTIIDANTFTISEYNTASNYAFVGSGTFIYYVNISTHGWNSVHLPIVYKLVSNLWPINSYDTVRTVSSFANDNGYTKITCSGAIKSDVTELEYVKIVGGTPGIYQILAWYSTSIVTINLPYTSNLTFTSVQYYYNNYHARIRVYAGINSGHIYQSQKPFSLITEQKFIPDSNGVITVNINEFLKQKIDVLKNDLLKGTLQNNIDAFCQFYISYAEGYDYSAGGYTLLDYVSSYQADDFAFIGYAVNSDLPFKNTYSGSMSNYLYGGPGYKLKFLTPSLYPELTPNNYFDISFINQVGSNLRIKKEAYKNGSIINLSFDNIDNKDIGIYRYQVSQSIYLEDRIDITLQNSGTVSVPAISGGFSNNGSGTSWNTAVPSVALTTANAFSKYLTTPFNAIPGVTYSFTMSATMSTFNVSSFIITLLDSSFNPTDQIYSDTGNFSNVLSSVIATKASSYIGVIAINDSTPGTTTYTLTKLTLNTDLSDINISETKTITVNSGFFNSGFAPYTNYNVCWLNYLGGFDWKVFQSAADLGVNIEDTKTVNKNIFQNWPNSFGEGADTIKQETSRTSRGTITLRAENLTSDQVNDLFRIKTSPLVQIVNATNDRRTIIPDTNSFIYYKQNQKLFNFEFTAELTDNLPSQSL